MVISEIEQLIRDACANVADAKDRIFIEYLTSRGLVADYEGWVGALNKDRERMKRLVLGE